MVTTYFSHISPFGHSIVKKHEKAGKKRTQEAREKRQKVSK